MPQINRIRVNNVKYNFGTQFYDDFLMRFSCKNSIYDLANGGGKSVLMLLLLQNLIPNCTLDEKQPVEKLFRTGNASTTIHSLIEWKLDSCDIKNGYKYMTTGFCARKARENAEETDHNTDAASIEYFNYCIFYREFGENDIKNLPLAKGNERITYNGLKTYLRDLEKKDLGIEVRIFDRKGDYQNFISRYGLFESQWEIVRGINKTEGHVRTYFENNYRTTRKVVEDLLIEEIIEKSYNNRIRKDTNDDDEMAKTLLDIKDKLIELSKRRAEMSCYDRQIELLDAFAEDIEGFKTFFNEKKQSEEKLITYLVTCKNRLSGKENKIEEYKKNIEKLEIKYNEEARLVNMAELETEETELDKIIDIIKETTEKRNVLSMECTELKNRLYMMENAADYKDYLDYKRKYDEILAFINSEGTGADDAVKEMNKLATTKAIITAERINTLKPQIEENEQKKANYTEELENTKSLILKKYGEVSSAEELEKVLSEEITASNEELEKNMNTVGLLVAENAEEKLNENAGRIQVVKKNIGELEALTDSVNADISKEIKNAAALESELTHISEESDRLESDYKKAEKTQERIDSLKNIYNAGSREQIEENIEKIYTSVNRELVIAKEDISKLEIIENSIREHKLPPYETALNTVMEYLKGRYGDDVISGRDELNRMSQEECLDAIKKFPELPYVILADESFAEISSDKVLRSLDTGSCIVPVVSRHIFEDEIPFSDEKIIDVYKDMSFIWNEGNAAELGKISEDKARLADSIRRLSDKCEVIYNDLIFVKQYAKMEQYEELRERIAILKDKYADAISEKELSVVKIDSLKEKLDNLRTSMTAERLLHDSLNREKQFLENVKSLNARIGSLYEKSRLNKERLSVCHREYNDCVSKARDRENKLKEITQKLNGLNEELEFITSDFDQNYRPYVVENVLPYENLSEEEIDAKAGALRKIINKEQGNLADKQNLLNTYDISMKKCLSSMKYRGMQKEAAEESYKNGELKAGTVEDMLAVKADINKIEKEMKETEDIFDSQNAQKNRIEGSFDYAKNQYESKYGEYVRTRIADPASYIASHRNEMSGIKAESLKLDKDIKELENANKDIMLMERDLNRLVNMTGLEIPENAEQISENEEISIQKIDNARKRYEDILKDEQKRKDKFTVSKQKLTDSLNACNGYELAEEIKRSVMVPSELSDVESLCRGIKDTNDCIALERDRIEKSISDMERIKDSFENRCVQICSNIRTELDRLPKLSRITLDEETISIITLAIPYIKEEMYKDRMSSYINETVSGAETLHTPDEKLKYIRGRLSWKKLFSVIVTDMNSIKLCLYKREHIKDQSRYLKYEEAVGSTGQSQGIYIQFLIAIINYISSINATGRDTSVIGKTIFIDNPFGAAKDVYIWEPIFKLLKTNHVQLIVPARGVTPAITRMFDVNYVLGQKMAAGKQQTVIVDYRSQVQTEEMEYNRMDYEQTTLELGI